MCEITPALSRFRVLLISISEHVRNHYDALLRGGGARGADRRAGPGDIWSGGMVVVVVVFNEK